MKREVPWNPGLSDESQVQLAEQLAGGETSPSGRMVRQELRKRIRATLQQLSDRHREIVVLRHLEQLPFKDIAAVLAITEAAAQSQYRRAVEMLHRLLSGEVEDE